MFIRLEQKFDSPEDSPFFLTDTWSLAQGQGLKKLSLFKKQNDEEPLAHFTYYTYRRMGLEVIITPPLAPYCGFRFYHRSDKKLSRLSDEKRAMRAIADYFSSSHPSAHIDLALPPRIRDIQPFQQCGFQTAISYTYLLKLDDKKAEELLSEMSAERRKNIRDATKKNFEVQINSNRKSILDLIKETLDSQGVKSHSELLSNLFSADDNRIFTVAVYDQNKLQSAAVVATDSLKAYYLAGGSTKDTSGAGALMLWSAILEARKREIPQFDFCGSSNPLIEKFFRGFGGELTPCFRVLSPNFIFDVLQTAKRKFRK